MGNVFYFEWEITLMEWLQGNSNKLMEILAWFFTQFGEEMVLVGLVGFLYWAVNKEFGKQLGRDMLVLFLSAPMLKNIAMRRRPYFDNPGIQCLRPAEKGVDMFDVSAQGFSFPSIHAGNTMTLFGVLAKHYRKRLGYLLAGLTIFMVGYSRVFLGVHYPTDVLAGWALGWIVVTIVDSLQVRIKSQLVFGAILAAAALPGWFFCKSTDFYTAYGITIGMTVGFWFEEKYVRFENTKNVLSMLLRTVLGVALFLIINSALKLPFDKDFLNTAAFLPFALRTCRYAAASFVILGVYPMSFAHLERFLNKRNQRG